jgi:hypothetical protein
MPTSTPNPIRVHFYTSKQFAYTLTTTLPSLCAINTRIFHLASQLPSSRCPNFYLSNKLSQKLSLSFTISEETRKVGLDSGGVVELEKECEQCGIVIYVLSLFFMRQA